MELSAALLCLAMAVYHEARGEPLAGQVAVAHVVLNRARADAWPGDVCAVVTQPRQFSFHWGPPRESCAWERAVVVADRVLAGDTADPTGGALHYHRRGLRRVWSAGMHQVHIGGHVFFVEGSR